MNKFLLLALVLLSIFGELNCNKYNNNYPNQRKDKEKQREICPFKKVRRELKDKTKCYELYGKVCCNTVKRMATEEATNPAPLIVEMEERVGNQKTSLSEGFVMTQALVEATTFSSTTTTSSTLRTTKPSDEPIVGVENNVISTERPATEPIVGDENEVISIERPTIGTTHETTTQTLTENTSKANKASLVDIKEQLKEQVTSLLAKIDQTNSILTQKEIEAQRIPVSLPSVSASDILRITNSKLSPKDAIKALRILAYKKIAENLKNGE